MKIYISSYYNVRFFKQNIIPIGTSGSWPFWIFTSNNRRPGSLFVDKNNVMNGIKEELFSDFGSIFESLSEKCGEAKPCPYLDKVPNCQFMTEYYKYLEKQDFNYLINEFKRVAEDVRKITNYEGEPTIVLLVYESSKCNCAERPCIQKWFKANGYNLEEWNKDLVEEDVF